MPLPPTVSVTTTPSIDGWEIDTYLGPVVAHSVAGTGFLSDWLAGWSDVFGGRSGAYQHQLRSLSDEAILALQQKAARLHANWIVGLTVDMDEISGKGKTMFMVTTMGTAVRARRVRDPDPVVVSTSGDAGPVSAEQVDATRQRVRVLAALEQNTLRFTDETWATLIEQRLAAVLPAVVKTLATLQTTQHAQLASFRERAIAFVERLDPADASAALHVSVGESEELPAEGRPDPAALAQGSQEPDDQLSEGEAFEHDASIRHRSRLSSVAQEPRHRCAPLSLGERADGQSPWADRGDGRPATGV